MVAGFFSRESVSTVSLNRVWKAGVLDDHNLIPKLLPNFIANVELIEGDGGLGTIKKVNFTQAVKDVQFIIEKTELLDEENHIVKQSIIEGGLIGQRLKSYSVEFKFESINNSGTLGKIKVEYDTVDEKTLSIEEEEEIYQGLFLFIKAVEGYLIENPNSYV